MGSDVNEYLFGYIKRFRPQTGGKWTLRKKILEGTKKFWEFRIIFLYNLKWPCKTSQIFPKHGLYFYI